MTKSASPEPNDFMPVKTFRPLTTSTRYIPSSAFHEITKSKPERSRIEIRKKSGGRNMYGRVTARGIGGGHKQFYRNVDFKRNKHIEAEVIGIEYDPIRTARLALLKYKDGDLRYIIAPVGLKIGAKLMNGPRLPRNSAIRCRCVSFPSARPFIISKWRQGAAARWSAPPAARRP